MEFTLGPRTWELRWFEISRKKFEAEYEVWEMREKTHLPSRDTGSEFSI